MKNVLFTPWVGENYATKGYNGKKILVLGESHYCDDGCKTCGSEKCTITCSVMERFLEYKQGKHTFNPKEDRWMNTLTRFTNGVTGNQSDVADFWNSVVFYNFVQKAMKSRKDKPTKEDFKNSHPAFFEVLEKYQPDIIIVWGNKLWHGMPGAGIGRHGDTPILDENGGKFYYYKVGNKEIPAYKVNHPAWGGAFSKSIPYLQEAIKLA
ncbi:hypothetical protein AGMMS49982_18600 [Bacteroidia bacterium]|nr:hypothetical protein AGMMS49982_18600 [Bacteroidia bacterium]